MKNRLPYNTKLKDRVRYLRKNMTKPEMKLWHEFLRDLPKQLAINPLDVHEKQLPLNPPHLRGRELIFDSGDFVQNPPQVRGRGAIASRGRKYRVYRQRPIDNFIVDFYIPDLKLVIEIDGESHFSEQAEVYDEQRTDILQGLGLKVLRFTNIEVMNNFNGVCERI